uniref:hypothetical protein n=1 Tax=Sphingobacterium sp. TaxID=341027 RepID=UPI0028B22452
GWTKNMKQTRMERMRGWTRTIDLTGMMEKGGWGRDRKGRTLCAMVLHCPPIMQALGRGGGNPGPAQILAHPRIPLILVQKSSHPGGERSRRESWFKYMGRANAIRPYRGREFWFKTPSSLST